MKGLLIDTPKVFRLHLLSFAGLAAIYSSASYDEVQLAVERDKVEFEMGSGMTTPPKPPGRRKPQ